jgi:asparagine synthetase B (glutamine-hydrolysing)
VAFENPRVHSTLPPGADSAYETCPDRITARHSLAELQRVCLGRNWNLIPINIPYTESSAHKPLVLNLVHPHNTEMDLSIALALYFAARGPTDAKVLFSGLGADELFGGYQRHGLAFKRGGYQALLDELTLDTERLGKRNLGRDDRATARWAREVRYPFLDEGVVAWAMEAAVWEKVGFGPSKTSGDGGEGERERVELDDKLVLRCVAKKLGMSGVAEEKKRAIQFGSRSAKMERGRVKGTEMVS